MTRRLLPMMILAASLAVPALARAEEGRLAEAARSALDAERRAAHETDPVAREAARRDAARRDADARSLAREELRATDRGATGRGARVDRAELRDVRMFGGRELSRAQSRERDLRNERQDNRERLRDLDRNERSQEREREREFDHDGDLDDRGESGSHDDGSGGRGDNDGH